MTNEIDINKGSINNASKGTKIRFNFNIDKIKSKSNFFIIKYIVRKVIYYIDSWEKLVIKKKSMNIFEIFYYFFILRTKKPYIELYNKIRNEENDKTNKSYKKKLEESYFKSFINNENVDGVSKCFNSYSLVFFMSKVTLVGTLLNDFFKRFKNFDSFLPNFFNDFCKNVLLSESKKFVYFEGILHTLKESIVEGELNKNITLAKLRIWMSKITSNTAKEINALKDFLAKRLKIKFDSTNDGIEGVEIRNLIKRLTYFERIKYGFISDDILTKINKNAEKYSSLKERRELDEKIFTEMFVSLKMYNDNEVKEKKEELKKIYDKILEKTKEILNIKEKERVEEINKLDKEINELNEEFENKKSEIQKKENGYIKSAEDRSKNHNSSDYALCEGEIKKIINTNLKNKNNIINVEKLEKNIKKAEEEVKSKNINIEEVDEIENFKKDREKRSKKRINKKILKDKTKKSKSNTVKNEVKNSKKSTKKRTKTETK